MSHLIGVTLRNRYKIFQCLGGGGFGDTYLARDLDLPGQPQCVVKHLKPKDSSPAVLAIATRLFETEAQTLYRLGNAHNQIPKLFAHFEENGEFYLVQEFVDGHDLTKEIISGSSKSEQVVFKLLKDILEVLAFVHQQNVIHRDIKLQNLMRRRKDCYETILQPGALIRIKAPRQMGKTSLLTRVLDHGTQHGCQTAYLNFQAADAEFFTSLDKFLQWFCGSIAQELNLKDKLSEYWQGVLGSKDKCTNYFQRYLLSEIHSPIVLGLDEVDQVFQYPQVASEFFGLLRAWHETSKNKETWKKLRLVIVHSKEVYIPLNINQLKL
ncbi:MAG: AAA-like domain-containing protein [Brasilonema angustatum HA4187-MV1]|jgi:serine/threonine protein kinase|nr:AAA-like domain-containing protein [Brasilonema angustatum HA4187-MV1]